MAMTNFAANDSLAVKLWARSLAMETLKYTEIARLIGTDPDSVIQRQEETQRGAGDRVTIALQMQLTQAGFSENQIGEGNGEALQFYNDSLNINELMGVVGVKGPGTIDQQRVWFDLRTRARSGLAQWWAKRYSISFFNQVCGYTPQTDTRFTGLNAVIAPSSTRIIRQSARTDDASLTSADTFTLNLLDAARERARLASPMVRPLIVEGRDRDGKRDWNNTLTDKYVFYMSPSQVTDMRTNTSTGQWMDLVKTANQGRGSSNNPIYTGAIGEYNGIILRESPDTTNGVSNAGADVPNVKRGVLLGAQAALMAFGRKDAPNEFQWHEELYDSRRRCEVSALQILGLKKTQFNSVDYGTVVVSTWGASH